MAVNGHRLNGARILYSALCSGETVEFVNSDPHLYPDVSPLLLKIHAALAEVFHLTGGGEMIDETFDDDDPIAQLAGDGSDWFALSDRLGLIAA